jgi:dihydroorotase
MNRDKVLVQRPGPRASLVIRNVRLLDPASGIDITDDIVIRDGYIGGDPTGLEEIDGTGLLVVPGFVDPHVHLRTPGREDTEDIGSGSRAAAAGGYVAIAAMPNTDPPVDDAQDLVRLRELAARDAVIGVGFICAITKGQQGSELTEAAELAELGAAALSDDGHPVSNAAVFRRALQYQHLARLPLTLHEEDMDLSASGAMHEGAVSARLGVGGIPAVSESVAVARDIALASYEDARIHICHVSARQTVDEVRLGKARGVHVTAEVSPHHLLLVDEDCESLDPATRKMNPPLRGTADRDALLAALIDGTIDCIATDHAPHGASEKELPFEEAPFGVTGLETAFASLYTHLVLRGKLPLEILVQRMTADAARVLELPVPTLTEGAVANLAVIDPTAKWVVGADGFQSKSRNSAFLDAKLVGEVQLTIAGGQIAWRR